MKLCNETITVFNKKIDPENGWDIYVPTIIQGVSWFCEIVSKVGDTGLQAANRFIIRIPLDADFGGKEYIDPVEYANEAITAGVFTLAQGDVIVKGAIDGEMQPADLKEQHYDFCTIVGVTDSRRAPNAKHFKVVGG